MEHLRVTPVKNTASGGNNANDTIRCCTGKKTHPTEGAATQFAQFIAKRHDQEAQRAYKCEFCTLWHLTSKEKVPTPVSVVSSSSMLAEKIKEASAASSQAFSHSNPAESTRLHGVDKEARNEEMRRLHKAGGWTHAKLAEKFGLSEGTVQQIIGRTGAYAERPVTKTTVESIDAEQEKLMAQLKALQEQKARLLEQRATKVQWCADGRMLVTKNGEHMALTRDEWNEVVSKVIDKLAVNETAAAASA
jgi:hypothetical protein